MEVGRNIYSKLGAQDSRSRYYGGNLYGSIHWIPADTVMNQRPETDQERVEMVNHFSRLPDDVIVRHVFDKISDTKSICHCSLVSKHFASLVLDTQTVTLKVPSWRPLCSCHEDPNAQPRPLLCRLGEHIFNFLSKPFKFVWWLIVRPFRWELVDTCFPDVIRTKPPAVENFLSKFSCIKSLSIDLSFIGISSNNGFKPLLRWKLDKHGFIFVSAENREVGGDGDDVTFEDEAVARLDLIKYHIMDAVYRIVFAILILDDFPHLKSVLVTDCFGQGRVELDEEGIDGIRNAENALEEKFCYCLKVWHLPVVKLPFSGCVMKEATLCVFKEVGIDDDDEELMVENAFEEKEYSELVRTILKKQTCYELKISASEPDGGILFEHGMDV